MHLRKNSRWCRELLLDIGSCLCAKVWRCQSSSVFFWLHVWSGELKQCERASQCRLYTAILTTTLLPLAYGWNAQRLINSWMWLWTLTTAMKSKWLAGVLWRVQRGLAAEPKRWSGAIGWWPELAASIVSSMQTPVLCPSWGESWICTG